MRFKDFLKEAQHRTDVSVEKAAELVAEHCKNMTLDRPIWRGSKGSKEEAYVIQGDQGGRSSANTSNFYTVCMDEFLPSLGYPARSKSIICASHDNEGYAGSYGNLFAIFPYDSTPVGVVFGDEDIWHLRIKVGSARRDKELEDWNQFYSDCGLADYSYEDFVRSIQDTLDDPDDDNYNLVSDVFDGDVEKILKRAYTPPSLSVKLMTNGEAAKLSGHHEMWLGGRCVAIRHDIWEKLVKK